MKFKDYEAVNRLSVAAGKEHAKMHDAVYALSERIKELPTDPDPEVGDSIREMDDLVQEAMDMCELLEEKLGAADKILERALVESPEE